MSFTINFFISCLIYIILYISAEDKISNYNNQTNETNNNTSQLSKYYYNDLIIEIIENKINDTFNDTHYNIENLKSTIEFFNHTELYNLEKSFNETYNKYKNEFISILNGKDINDDLFSNINQNTTKELFKSIKTNNTHNIYPYQYLPINYIKKINIDIWYEMLDSINSYSIALLNNNINNNNNNNIYIINRNQLLILTNHLNKLLNFIFYLTLKSNCNQIAWNLVINNYQEVYNLNYILKKLIKKYDYSITLLKSKNIKVIQEYNSIINEYNSLNLNIKGLIDIIINTKNDKLKHFIFIEDIFNDIKSIESFSFNLNENRNNWIISNKKLIKPLIYWLENSVYFINKTILIISKSIIAFHIRNFIDLINTFNESNNDINEMNELFIKSLDFFDISLKSIFNNIISIRNNDDVNIFNLIAEKLQNHLKILSSEYKNIIYKIIQYLKNNNIKQDFNLFIENSKSIISILWDKKINNYLKFNANFDNDLHANNGINNNELFIKIINYFNSQEFKKFSILQDYLLKLRYYNEMLLPELLLQFHIVQIELDKYYLNGNYNDIKLNAILKRKFINNFIEKCNSDKYINFKFNQQFKFINNKMINKYSMWDSENILFNEEDEIKFDIEYIIKNKSKSLIKNFYNIKDINQKKILLNNNINIDQIKFLKQQLISINNILKQEIENNQEKNIQSLILNLKKKNENIENYINELDIILKDINNYDKINMNYLINTIQELLNKYGYYKEYKFEDNINKNKYILTINNFKQELQNINKIIQNNMKNIKDISNYNYNINNLDNNKNILNNYLLKLENEIDIYCNSINKGNKTSRILSILKYMIRKKKPDTKCDNLIIDFSRYKNKALNLIKDTNDIIEEFKTNYNYCEEIENISYKYKTMINNYQQVNNSIQLLINSNTNTSFEEGINLVKDKINKLLEDSKYLLKQVDCYKEIKLSNIILDYNKYIKNEIIKLRNTIEKELKINLYED